MLQWHYFECLLLYNKIMDRLYEMIPDFQDDQPIETVDPFLIEIDCINSLNKKIRENIRGDETSQLIKQCAERIKNLKRTEKNCCSNHKIYGNYPRI